MNMKTTITSLLLATFALPAATFAQTIVFADNFNSATTGALLNGRTPDVAAASTTWVTSPTNGWVTINPTPLMASNLTPDTSMNAYGTPTAAPTLTEDFSISWDMQVANNVTGAYWTGVGLDDSTGSFITSSSLWLQVWASPTAQATTVRLFGGGAALTDVSDVNGIAAWNQGASNSIQLSYSASAETIDVSINSTVVFNDIDVSSTTFDAFTYFKVGTSSNYDGVNRGIQLDNISVAVIPEPSVMALLGGVGLLLVAVRGRNRLRHS